MKAALIALLTFVATAKGQLVTQSVDDLCLDSVKNCCEQVAGTGYVCAETCETGTAACDALCGGNIPVGGRAVCTSYDSPLPGSTADECRLVRPPTKANRDVGSCCVCEIKTGDDPWVAGMNGQRFLFEGRDGAWYALLHDPARKLTINTRIYEPKDKKEGTVSTFFDAIAVELSDENDEMHRILISAKDAKNFDHKCEEGKHCIANGAVEVEIDGVKVTEPSYHDVGDKTAFGIYNAPWECKSRPTSHNEWKEVEAAVLEKKKARKLLSLFEPEKEIIRYTPMNNVFDSKKCREWLIERHTHLDVFQQSGIHSTAMLLAPDFSMRLEFTFNKDPKWVDHQRFDIDLLGYKPSKDASGHYLTTGLMGETATIKYDPILNTPIVDGRDDVLSGPDSDYEVAGPFEKEFVARTRN